MNNCIGAKNLGLFYMFLLFTYTQLLIGGAVNVFYLIGFSYGGPAPFEPLISLDEFYIKLVDYVILAVIGFFLFLLSILVVV